VATIVATALALSLGACGGGPEPSADASGDAKAVGQELGGSVAQLAQCRDWVEGTEAQRLATVEDIRSHVNLEDTGVEASELTDDEAIEVFDNGCDEPAAEGYRLHVMYARAAAFKPLRDIAEGNG
jgi:hypothetical protein